MKISLEKLLKLPVVTEDGRKLGNIFDIIIDTDGQSVVQYAVRPSTLVGRIFNEDALLVSRDQVIAINENEVVVDSGIIKSSEEKKSKVRMESPINQAAATSTLNQEAEW